MRRVVVIACLALLLTPFAFAQWHGYILVQSLNLTAGQKATLVSGLQALGRRNNDPWPHLRNHWRVSTDQNSIILEAGCDRDR